MPETVNQHQVGTFSSPTNGDPLDAEVVRANDNAVATDHDAHDSDPGIHLQYSTFASRPAAGTAGRKWLTLTADGRLQLWRDNGTDWKEVTGTTFGLTNGQPGIHDIGNSGTSVAVDWNNGPIQKVTLNNSCTFTYTNAVAGSTYTLIIVQDGTGGWSATLGASWDFGENTPVFSTTANKKNVVSGLYDGTEYLAAFAVKGA